MTSFARAERSSCYRHLLLERQEDVTREHTGISGISKRTSRTPSSVKSQYQRARQAHCACDTRPDDKLRDQHHAHSQVKPCLEGKMCARKVLPVRNRGTLEVARRYFHSCATAHVEVGPRVVLPCAPALMLTAASLPQLLPPSAFLGRPHRSSSRSKKRRFGAAGEMILEIRALAFAAARRIGGCRTPPRCSTCHELSVRLRCCVCGRSFLPGAVTVAVPKIEENDS